MVLREIHSASHQILKAEEKKKMLRKYPFFKLEVVVGSGRDLIAMDRGGKFHSQILLYWYFTGYKYNTYAYHYVSLSLSEKEIASLWNFYSTTFHALVRKQSNI